MSSALYLFTGPELGEKADAVAALKAAAAKKHGTLDAHSFYMAESRLSDILALLTNGSLFADARFITVNGAESIKKKEDIALIAQWAHLNDTASTLVLVSDEVSVDKKLDALVPKENKKVFWEMFQDRKEQWLLSFFRRNGYTIDADAIETILELTENNTAALKNECSRFFVCFDKTHTITAADVENILSHNREESAFTLFDALASNGAPQFRLASALEILQKLRLSKESSGVALIAGLTYCFRKLTVWHALIAAGKTSPLDLKIKGFASKKVQDQNRRAAQLWTHDDAARILSLLAHTDMNIRSLGTSLETTQLQLMLYSIVFKKGRELVAYPTAEV